jgi:hypothetical protein
MWPFGKTKASLAPDDVSRGELTARYDRQLRRWSFKVDGIEFNLVGIPFNEAAFDWARECSGVMRASHVEIRARVMEFLEDWPCDKTKAEVLCVDLNKFGESRTMEVAFVGDDSWGDLGVNLIITDGKIVDVYGGD